MMNYKRNSNNGIRPLNNYTPQPYKNGFDENIIIRQRDKTKEIAAEIFSSVIPKDVWKNRVLQEKSIRAYKSLELLYANQAFPQSVKNQTLNPLKITKNITQALTSSKNFYGSHNKYFFY